MSKHSLKTLNGGELTATHTEAAKEAKKIPGAGKAYQQIMDNREGWINIGGKKRPHP